jgi:hypothetical protein
METIFYSLASKNNFNMALRHFFKVNEVVDDIENRKNLADIINNELDNEEVLKEQILPIVGAVIRDKFNYSYDSYNVPATVSEFNKIAEETSKWTAIDIVMLYYNPNANIFIINPKNIDHWEKVRELVQDQMIVIYARHNKSETKKKIEIEAIMAIEKMLAGKDVLINNEFIDNTVIAAPKPVEIKPIGPVGPVTAAAVTAKAALKQNKQSTPKYAVHVQNELFHNGNVEAWKKIIESFEVSHTDLRVVVFFEGEVINDINALFKWGKVKHGDPIFFQVVGENIKDVSKLQKYLFEGASPRFEQFLKIGVGKVLNLF